MGKSDDIKERKVLTPVFRLSYPNLAEPREQKDGSKKFGISMLFDKKTNMKVFQDAIAAATEQAYGAKPPKNLKNPIRDGDLERDDEQYAGHWFINANSKKQPGMVHQNRERIEQDEIEKVLYPGCYARATLIAFDYDTDGNRGISFSLQNIQKVRDGDPFSGRPDPEDEFDEIELEGEDASSGADDLDADDDLGF